MIQIESLPKFIPYIDIDTFSIHLLYSNLYRKIIYNKLNNQNNFETVNIVLETRMIINQKERKKQPY